jgi:hypothetical protein
MKKIKVFCDRCGKEFDEYTKNASDDDKAGFRFWFQQHKGNQFDFCEECKNIILERADKLFN